MKNLFPENSLHYYKKGKNKMIKPLGIFWCPLTGVTLQVSEPPADIASAVSAGDFFLSHAPLAVD
mgnify:CR=1 FL=1